MQVGQLGCLGLQTSTKRQTLLARAIAAIRRNNGTLFYVPANFAGSWTDSAGTDPVDAVADVIGRMTDRTGGSAVATQATTANKPTVRTNAQGAYVVRFDGSNDTFITNISTANEGWACAGALISSTAEQYLFWTGAHISSGAPAGISLRISSGTLQLLLGDGSTTRDVVTTPSTISTTTYAVYEGGWGGSSFFAAINGTETSGTKTRNCTSVTALSIGSRSTAGYLNASCTALVMCQTLPSAADRAIIRKWIGSLQEQTL